MFWTSTANMSLALRTDDRGTFRVAGLPPGEYIVGATGIVEHGELIKNLDLEANMVGSSLAMTFYPSATRVTQATPLRVELGKERGGVDITLAEGEAHALAGTACGRDDHSARKRSR